MRTQPEPHIQFPAPPNTTGDGGGSGFHTSRPHSSRYPSPPLSLPASKAPRWHVGPPRGTAHPPTTTDPPSPNLRAAYQVEARSRRWDGRRCHRHSLRRLETWGSYAPLDTATPTPTAPDLRSRPGSAPIAPPDPSSSTASSEGCTRCPPTSIVPTLLPLALAVGCTPTSAHRHSPALGASNPQQAPASAVGGCADTPNPSAKTP